MSEARSSIAAARDVRAGRVALSVVTAMHEIAVREAFPRLSRAGFDAMRRANEDFAAAMRAADIEAAIAADERFHAVAVAAAGNAALRTTLELFTPPLRRVERLRLAPLSDRDAIARHHRIVERGEAGDVAAAAAATRADWLSLAPLLDALDA